jgi:hypothetical protein
MHFMCDLKNWSDDRSAHSWLARSLFLFHADLFHCSVTTDFFAAQHFVPVHGCAGRIADCHAKASGLA